MYQYRQRRGQGNCPSLRSRSKIWIGAASKELKGFAKVDLQPGETKTVTIQLDFRAFAYYHPEL